LYLARVLKLEVSGSELEVSGSEHEVSGSELEVSGSELEVRTYALLYGKTNRRERRVHRGMRKRENFCVSPGSFRL